MCLTATSYLIHCAITFHIKSSLLVYVCVYVETPYTLFFFHWTHCFYFSFFVPLLHLNGVNEVYDFQLTLDTKRGLNFNSNERNVATARVISSSWLCFGGKIIFLARPHQIYFLSPAIIFTKRLHVHINQYPHHSVSSVIIIASALEGAQVALRGECPSASASKADEKTSTQTHTHTPLVSCHGQFERQ